VRDRGRNSLCFIFSQNAALFLSQYYHETEIHEILMQQYEKYYHDSSKRCASSFGVLRMSRDKENALRNGATPISCSPIIHSCSHTGHWALGTVTTLSRRQQLVEQRHHKATAPYVYIVTALLSSDSCLAVYHVTR